MDAGGHGYLSDQTPSARSVVAVCAVGRGMLDEPLKGRAVSPIVLWREGEDWVIAWSGNAVRGKSGLHGRGAGQFPGGAIRHQHHRE